MPLTPAHYIMLARCQGGFYSEMRDDDPQTAVVRELRDVDGERFVRFHLAGDNSFHVTLTFAGRRALRDAFNPLPSP